LKTTSHTDDPIRKEDSELIRELLEFDDTNFVKQAKICRLDPAADFQQLDLTDVDFSNCDLRGFDFSGSDLRGAFGVNVTWEIGNPVLDGADTSDSLFTHQLEQQNYFRDHPDDLALVERLSTDYWANAIVRVDDLLQSAPDKARAARISHAVFARHKDPSVRTNILLFMRSASGSASEHKHFISHLLAKSWNNASLTLSCLNALIAFYGNSRDTLNWLLKYLSYPDHRIRKTAFFALLDSSKFQTGFKEIRSYAMSCDDRIQRRAFVGRSAKMVGHGAEAALYNYKEGNFLDFRTILDRPLLVDTWSPRGFADFRERARVNNRHVPIEVLQEEYFQLRLDSICRFGRRSEVYFRFSTGSDLVELGKNDRPKINAA
jgi:hypothetical protein